MPWLPELFTAPALERVWEADERLRRLALVPFFAGIATGEIGAVVDSFAGEPELHHPVRGRIRGAAAFERYARETQAWMADRDVAFEQVGFVIDPPCGVEEVVLRVAGRIELPVAIATDHDERGAITEQRMYFSSRPLTGRHAIRPPVLQADPAVRAGGAAGALRRALADGDAEAAVAAFAPDGTLREPAGSAFTHRGAGELRALFERFFSNGGGLRFEHCAVADDGRACALEYNLVAWGRTALPAQAGLAVHVRGDGGRLAAARIYDDVDPPPALGRRLSSPRGSGRRARSTTA